MTVDGADAGSPRRKDSMSGGTGESRRKDKLKGGPAVASRPEPMKSPLKENEASGGAGVPKREARTRRDSGGKAAGTGKASGEKITGAGIMIRGRIVSRGVAEGVALVGKEALSFYGSIDFGTGKVIEKGNPLFGMSVKDTILVFPGGKGSTVGSYGLYRLKKSGLAPKAIINVETEPIIAAGAIISDIPLIDKLENDPLAVIRTGMRVKVDCVKGFVLLP